MITLNIEKRDMAVKPQSLRKEGRIPAVFYGRKEVSTPITLSKIDFKKVWKEAGESSVIVLSGADGEHEALINDVDVDPVTEEPRHVDFYVIEKGKKVTVTIPLDFVGVSPAVKELGAVLVKVLHEIEIEVLPKDLPHEITVDISSLSQFDQHITIADLSIPEGVTILAAAEDIVVLVSEPKEEVEPEPVDISSIKVEEKGKKEEETPAAE